MCPRLALADEAVESLSRGLGACRRSAGGTRRGAADGAWPSAAKRRGESVELLIKPKVKAAFLTVLYLSVLVPSLAASVSRTQAQEPAPAKTDSDEDERWLM